MKLQKIPVTLMLTESELRILQDYLKAKMFIMASILIKDVYKRGDMLTKLNSQKAGGL